MEGSKEVLPPGWFITDTSAGGSAEIADSSINVVVHADGESNCSTSHMDSVGPHDANGHPLSNTDFGEGQRIDWRGHGQSDHHTRYPQCEGPGLPERG